VEDFSDALLVGASVVAAAHLLHQLSCEFDRGTGFWVKTEGFAGRFPSFPPDDHFISDTRNKSELRFFQLPRKSDLSFAFRWVKYKHDVHSANSLPLGSPAWSYPSSNSKIFATAGRQCSSLSLQRAVISSQPPPLYRSGLENSTRKSRFFPTENFPFSRCREWQDGSDYRMKAEIAKSAATL
jgi:hypothetical protein